jgi:hypothetical protein
MKIINKKHNDKALVYFAAILINSARGQWKSFSKSIRRAKDRIFKA